MNLEEKVSVLHQLEERVRELEKRIIDLEEHVIDAKVQKKTESVITDYAPTMVKEYIKRDKERRSVK